MYTLNPVSEYSMDSLREIILAHAQKYPAMQPGDAVKLLYQSEFGAGHLISDPATALSRLKNEYFQTPRGKYYAEPIGGGKARVYLGGIPERSLDSFNTLFVTGASHPEGSREHFDLSLRLLEDMTESGLLPFSSQALGEYLTPYREEGCPMVSHTAEYHDAYNPAYRVLPALFAAVLPFVFRIDEQLYSCGSAVLTIDGQCGSGKTTIAALLSRLYNASVIHMDDFFVPPGVRDESHSLVNCDYARFSREVLPQIKAIYESGFNPDGAQIKYRRFDCETMDFGDFALLPATRLLIIEGSYSLAPVFGRYYDLSAYVRTSMDTRLMRLKKRCDDDELFERFVNEWIPREEHYDFVCSVSGNADIIIDA